MPTDQPRGGRTAASVDATGQHRIRARVAHDPLSLLGKAYEAPMSGAAIAQVFNKRAKQAGLDPALFGGHSTRLGAAEDLVAAGASELKVMQAGRWKTPTMVARYTEHLRDSENAMMVLRKTKGRLSKG